MNVNRANEPREKKLYTYPSELEFISLMYYAEKRKYNKIIKALLIKISRNLPGTTKQKYYIKLYKEYKHYLNDTNKLIKESKLNLPNYIKEEVV